MGYPLQKEFAMSETVPKPFARWKRWLLEGALFFCILFAIQYWEARDVPRGPAPQFQGILAGGGETSLAAWRAQHPGKPVLLYFWAGWCPICKTVAGSVDAIARDWPVLTVAMQSGAEERVAKFLDEHQRGWPTIVDEDGQITARYRFRGVPAFAVVDAAGDIRFVETGYTSEIGLRLRLWWAKRTAGG